MSHKPSFLYVEDEPMSRTVMKMLMTKGLGYEDITIFENSENFMQRVEELPYKPDLIFLDIHMLPYDGFHMLQLLRQHPEYCNTVIIALTASVMNEEVDMLKRAGFNGAISKPIDQSTFPAILHQILNGEEVWSIF